MKRWAPLLGLCCLAPGPCEGGGGDGDDFRADGTDVPAGTDDTGSDTTGATTGGTTPSGFLTWSLTCDGDNQEYTWTASAELDFGASYVTVTLDPDTAGWDTFTLDPQDGEGRTWSSDTTELETARSCNTTAVLEWYALSNSGGDATAEGSYP